MAFWGGGGEGKKETLACKIDAARHLGDDRGLVYTNATSAKGRGGQPVRRQNEDAAGHAHRGLKKTHMIPRLIEAMTPTFSRVTICTLQITKVGNAVRTRSMAAE